MKLQSNFPKGFDKKNLKTFQKKSTEERKKKFETEHNQNVEALKLQQKINTPIFEKIKYSEDEIKNYKKLAKESAEYALNAKPPAPDLYKTHNHVKYRPFDNTFNQETGGGLGLYYNRYGPDHRTGRTGVNFGIINLAGSMTSVSSVGFWYYAQTSGTVHFRVNADIFFRAAVVSFPFGYAYSLAALQINVEQYTGAFRVWNARNVIYEHGGFIAASFPEIHRQSRSASVPVQVNAGSLYCIWGDAIQTVSAFGPASAANNLDCFINSFDY